MNFNFVGWLVGVVVFGERIGGGGQVNNVRYHDNSGGDSFQVGATVQIGAGFLFFYVPFGNLDICTYTDDVFARKDKQRE